MIKIYKILTIFLILSPAFISFNYSQEKEIQKNDLEKMNLYGHVKSLREIQYEVINEKISITSRRHRYYMFDENGLKVEESKRESSL